MITVKAPSTYKPEREYIVRVIMGEFLGLEYQISFGNHANTTLSCDSGDELILPDTLFQIPPEDWLTDKSLPQRPLYVFDAKSNKTDCRLVDQYVPIIYGTNPQKSDPANYLPIDIFGSAFFMLSRYEELVKRDMDDHSRFPAAASLAYQEGFIDRPIVNEYTELLWFALKSKWNGLKRRRRSFRILPSHDVDKPFEYAFLSTKELFKSCLTESARKRSAGFLKPVFNYLTHSKRLISDDPYNTFQWIMDINEKNGLQSTFYFFGQKTHLDIDGQYDIQDPGARRW